MKPFRSLTFDAKTKGAKKDKAFKPNKKAESEFYKALRKVARAAGNLVESHIDGTKIENERELEKQILAYSKALEPWARSQSAKLIAASDKKTKTALKNYAKNFGATLRQQLGDIGVLSESRDLIQEQTKLIQSLPLDTLQRAQKLSQEALLNGSRAEEIAKELMRTTSVSETRAQLIAVTEAARTSAVINQVRSQAAGSKRYVWRTSEDAAVRPSHREMDGKIFSWDHPPTLSDGMKGHPGEFPRCRCYAESIFDE